MVMESPPILADTHCHLEFEAFDADRKDVIKRARQVGVAYILNPGVDLPSSRAAVSLSETEDIVYAAVGIHPNDILHAGVGLAASQAGGSEQETGWNDQYLEDVERLAGQAKVRAIGEIGLDYYREWTLPNLQRDVFRKQLHLAEKLQLPVIVHCREAMEDTLQILAEWQAGLSKKNSPLWGRPGVLHSFSGTLEEARQAVSMNFCIGITGPVTYRKPGHMQEVVAGLPLEWLLVETDAPFLAPVPQRGKRNEPAFVRLVAEKFASILNQPVEGIAAATTANARRLFNW